MQDDRAIQATYHSYRPILGRKVLQLIFEVPIEAQEATFAALGYPQPDESLWVGIARLNLDLNGQPATATDKSAPKLAQIAGILCNEGGFWKFLEAKGDYRVSSADEAATYVRLICGVKSRSELDTNINAASIWRDLKADYEFWLRDEAA